MENQLMEMKFEGTAVRIVKDENGEPWVVAKDVAERLGYVWKGATGTIPHIPEEWKGVYSVQTPWGVQEMITLSEQGLYFFLNRSDKPKAIPFQKWIAGEVIPSIRKTGSYSVQEALPRNYLEALKELVVYVEKSNRLEGQLAIAAPKAEFYDAVGQSKNALSMREVAKLIGYSGIGQNNLFNFLKNQKILISKSEPYQEFVNRGYFKVIMIPYTNRFGETYTRNKILTTGRGIDFIRRTLMKRLRETNHQEAFNL